MGDYAEHLVWESEGRRGAAERGWLGEEERERELERQREEAEEYDRAGRDPSEWPADLRVMEVR